MNALAQRVLAAAAIVLVMPHALALVPGDHTITLGTRSYVVHVPQRFESRPAVVLNFHGGGGTADAHKKYVRMDALADREGILAVYPEGSGGIGGKLLTWNAGACCGASARQDVDDVAFVRALLDDLAQRHAYDAARVYATGLSNGAMMSYRLAAELSDRIAAIAPVAGSMVLVHFAPRRPVPVLHIHSVDDGRALYNGGLGPPFPFTNARVLHPPVEERLADWARANGCVGEPQATGRREWHGHSATLLAYRGCQAETALWKLTGAGHVWPGGELDYLPRLLGPGTAVIDANEEMWRFFRRHRVPLD